MGDKKKLRTVILLLCDKRTIAAEVVEKYAPADVWTLNNCFRKESTLHFQLHGFQTMLHAHGKDYFRKLAALAVPLVLFPKQAESFASYTQKLYGEDIGQPTIKTFLVEEVLAMGGRPYLDNSVNWMTALAILEGYERIVLAGVSYGDELKTLWKAREAAADIIEGNPSADYRTRDARRLLVEDLRGWGVGEESWAIPCISYWAGIAQGRGVEFVAEGEHHGIFFDRWSKGKGSALYGIDSRAGGL
jgi:hypothetical protein